jgi:para-nitrobenzyl esterase
LKRACERVIADQLDLFLLSFGVDGMRRSSTFAVALGLCAVLAVGLMSASARAQDRQTADGTVRGRPQPDGSVVYTSIPYAAPPVGALRWKPPQPVVPWTGVYQADTPKPCLQLDEGWNTKDVAISGEDCLYLSIREPKHKSGEKLPVFVWIHGGSNRAGDGFGSAADSSLYKHGVVLVGIEYRLGVFGFLAAPDLSNESPHHSSGNYALLDQIAALQWVKKNISAFGGDPSNVTIGGQSAGGFDVEFLMRSPLAEGLFHKAIVESGGVGPLRSAAENERGGSGLIAAMGAPSGPGALPFLRAASAQSLMDASKKLQLDNTWTQPTADGWVIPEPANDIYKSGLQAHVPLIVGNVAREFPVDAPAEAMRQLLRQAYGPNAEQAIAFYGLDAGKTPPEDKVFGGFGTQIVTDLVFKCPSIQVAHWEIVSGQKVWRYQFGIARPGLKDVAHNAELDYVFLSPPAGATPVTWPPLQSYWANFMRTGDPNGAGLAPWPDMGAQGRFMAFTPEGAVAGVDPRAAICDLFAKAREAGGRP